MLFVTEQVCYYLVQIILGLASAILFVINISSFIFLCDHCAVRSAVYPALYDQQLSR